MAAINKEFFFTYFQYKKVSFAKKKRKYENRKDIAELLPWRHLATQDRNSGRKKESWNRYPKELEKIPSTKITSAHFGRQKVAPRLERRPPKNGG